MYEIYPINNVYTEFIVSMGGSTITDNNDDWWFWEIVGDIALRNEEYKLVHLSSR